MSIYNLGLIVLVLLTNRCDSSESVPRNYYNCYFYKYFGLNSTERVAQRIDFVEKMLEKKRPESVIPPTQACVEWMCDKNLV